MTTVSFPKPRDLGPREWGSETLVVDSPLGFTGKFLFMKAGSRGGLQYHRQKHEFAFLISGVLRVYFDEGDGALQWVNLTAGTSIEIPPGAVHQEEAITDCNIFEVSNRVFNDRVRCEANYGLPESGGLPTTQESEVRYEP